MLVAKTALIGSKKLFDCEGIDLLRKVVADRRKVLSNDIAKAYSLSSSDLECQVKNGQLSVRESVCTLGKSSSHCKDTYLFRSGKHTTVEYLRDSATEVWMRGHGSPQR